MNELALIFDRLGIRTADVLAAAGTKWNFLPFTPGLVGGHCIGVDPYYLTTKAEQLGYQPEVILAGRRINDRMGEHIATTLVKLLIDAGHPRQRRARRRARAHLQGERLRPAQQPRAGHHPELREYGIEALVHDPLASPDEAMAEYGVTLRPLEELTGPRRSRPRGAAPGLSRRTLEQVTGLGPRWRCAHRRQVRHLAAVAARAHHRLEPLIAHPIGIRRSKVSTSARSKTSGSSRVAPGAWRPMAG